MNVMQVGNIAVIIVSLIAEGVWVRFNPDKALLAIPIVMWLVHSLIFYLVVACHPIKAVSGTYYEWSSGLRLQGYVTVLMLTLYRLNGRFLKWIGYK